jgi:hypothetical protein
MCGLGSSLKTHLSSQMPYSISILIELYELGMETIYNLSRIVAIFVLRSSEN